VKQLERKVQFDP